MSTGGAFSGVKAAAV